MNQHIHDTSSSASPSPRTTRASYTVRYRRYFFGVSAGVLFLSITSLAGWILDIPILRQWLPDYSPTSPASSLALLTLGIATLLLTEPRLNRLTWILAFVVALIALISLLAYYALLPIPAGMSWLLQQNQQMPLATACCFLLVAIAYAGSGSVSVRIQRLAQWCAHAATVISFVSVIGLIMRIPIGFNLIHLDMMSIPSSFALFASSLIITLRNDHLGITALFSSRKLGNMAMRKTYPATVLMVCVLGYLRITSHRWNLVDVELGIVLFMISFLLVSLFIGWEVTRRLNKADDARANVERMLKDERALLRALIDHLPLNVYVKDTNSRKTMANRAEYEYMGSYRESDILGKSDHELFPPESASISVDEDQQVMTSGIPILNKETINIKKDGTRRWFLVSKIPLRNQQHEIAGLVGISYDITERKKAEQIIREERDRFQKLVATVPGVVHTLHQSPEGTLRFLYTSPGVTELTGFTPEELAADFSLLRSRMVDEDHDRLVAKMEEASTKRSMLYEEYRILHPTRGTLWVEVRAVPSFLSDGGIYWYGVLMDVTLRKKSEKALQESEEQFSKAFRLSPAAISISRNTDGCLLDVNESAEALVGYKREEMIGRTTLSLGIVLPETQAYIEQVMKQGPVRQLEVDIYTREGERRSTLLSSESLVIHGERCTLAISFDITERKKAEAKVREAEKRFQDTLDTMIEGCQIIDFNWRYTYINPEAAKQAHTVPQALLGYTMMEKFPGIENTQLFSVLQHCMATRTNAQMENEFVYPDGGRGWFELHIQPAAEGIFILSLDITHRKRADEELRRLNQTISEMNVGLEQKVTERTQELQTVNHELESFSYSVSHDLRAPLRAINGYARMLEEDYEGALDANGIRILGTIQHNARHMGLLIDDLLAFSRLGRKKIQKGLTDMTTLVNNVLSEIHQNTPHQAEITIKHLLPAWADAVLIKQVWVNLIGNAVKYSSAKPDPRIEISSYRENDEVFYQVKDNGAGFDMAYVHKLFNVFQRLHTMDEFEGSGVGLAIVKRIIEKHNGRVWAEGSIDAGAIFTFSLPDPTPNEIDDTEH